MTSRPPGSRFSSASTTGVQAGVVSMMAASGSGDGLGGVAGPGRAELAGEGPLRLGAGEDEDRVVGEAVPDQFQHEVRRGAEAGQAQALAVLQPGQAERPEADRPGAEQRGGLRVGEDVGDGVGKRRGHGHQLGIAAVGVAPGRPEWSQRFSSPRRQKSQSPHAEKIQATPTRSPSRKPAAPSPSASTRPTT